MPAVFALLFALHLAPTSAPVVSGPSPAASADTVTLNEFAWFDPARRVVGLRVIGGHEGVNSGMSFNGAASGSATLTVPMGWQVQVTFVNRDAAMPHSVIVVRAADPVPVVAGDPAFPGAVSKEPVQGLAEGEESRFTFTAARAGSYMILCAVPGHGTAGMWIGLAVSTTANRPTYK